MRETRGYVRRLAAAALLAAALMASGCGAPQAVGTQATASPRPLDPQHSVLHVVSETTYRLWDGVPAPLAGKPSVYRDEFWYDAQGRMLRSEYRVLEKGRFIPERIQLMRDGVWSTYMQYWGAAGSPRVDESNAPTSFATVDGGYFDAFRDWRAIRASGLATLTGTASLDGTPTYLLRILTVTGDSGRQTVAEVRRSDYQPLRVTYESFGHDAAGKRVVGERDVTVAQRVERVPFASVASEFRLDVPKNVPVFAHLTLSRPQAAALRRPRVYWAGPSVAGLRFEGDFVLEKGREDRVAPSGPYHLWPRLGQPEYEAHYSDPKAREAARHSLSIHENWPEIVVTSVRRVDPSVWPRVPGAVDTSVSGHRALRAGPWMIVDMGDATVVVWAGQRASDAVIDAAARNLAAVP